jgi:hypothetical protein
VWHWLHPSSTPAKINNSSNKIFLQVVNKAKLLFLEKTTLKLLIKENTSKKEYLNSMNQKTKITI